ncbi:hypothetical protein BDFB_011629 [Asbolus verrucosus]|uniref:Uncharacterized protein n=1 Tax=Asbolus verrucosus TaxID=1661398 RepID=A0A482V9Z3_ASBVE|nr:hypothetical protein BDFB_011629 [Asbolus verrucosus]
MLETVRLDLIPLLIISSGILHNICIMNGDFLETILNLPEELLEEIRMNPRN